MQKFIPRSRVSIFSNECTRSTPLDPKLLFASVVFGCIWDHFVASRYSVENGPNWCDKCKSSCHKVALDVFTTNTPNPPHWNLNSVPRSKLSAKWSELVQLMQKFVPRSCVGSFPNERT